MSVERKYIFVRHGESVVNSRPENPIGTISNRPSVYAPLTEHGRQQADETIDSFGDLDVIEIHTSPLTRAEETARRIGNKFGVKVIIADGLREPDCGIIEGRKDAEAWEIHAAQEQAWRDGNDDYHIPEGESLRDVEQRFRPYVEGVIAQHKDDDGTVIFVSHGSVLRNMLPRMLGNINMNYAHAHPLRNCDYVVVNNTDRGLICTYWGGEKLPNTGI